VPVDGSTTSSEASPRLSRYPPSTKFCSRSMAVLPGQASYPPG
jgi:hypothetical protein